MAGFQGQVLGHLVRRGLDAVNENEQARIIVAKLRHDAELYENSGPEMELSPMQFVPAIITFILVVAVIASVKYTVGEVAASLTMIESRTTTAIVEDKPPAYSDEPDAPLEKEVPVQMEPESGVEVTLVKNQLITSKLKTTIRHLTRIGGFRARWRGLGWSIAYHMLHALVANGISGLLHFGFIGHTLMTIFTSVAMARVHMAWTHSMIAYPSKKRENRIRRVPRKQCRVLLLPALVYAVAEHATVFLPLGVAWAVALETDRMPLQMYKHAADGDCQALVLNALRALAPLATLVFVALAVLLPANVTLTRIEAALLPEDEDTIVPFDREAVVGNIDLTARGSSRAVFVQAWRSFDCSARWRLVKLYTKMVMIQFMTFIVGLHLIIAELYVFGGEKLGLALKSGAAQLQLAAIEEYENGPHPVHELIN